MTTPFIGTYQIPAESSSSRIPLRSLSNILSLNTELARSLVNLSSSIPSDFKEKETRAVRLCILENAYRLSKLIEAIFCETGFVSLRTHEIK